MARATVAVFLAAASLFVGCAAAPPPPPAAPASPGACPAASSDPLCAMSEEQLARKMIEVTGAAELGKKMADSILDTLTKKKMIPPAMIARLKRNIHPEELTDLVVPIYVKHYKRETMIAAIRFYQSPEGEALIRELPAATDESMAAGREWGRRVAERTFKDMAEIGREQ